MALWQSLVTWSRRPLANNPAAKILAFLLAFGVWFFVQGQQVMEVKTLVRVEYRWPDQLALSEPAPPQIRLSANGPRSLVRGLANRDIRVLVDMSGATAGVQSVEFQGRQFEGLPQGVEVVSTIPSSIQVDLVRSVSRKVKVQPATVGRVADGYHLADVVLVPSEVEVRGPANVLASLDALHTDGIAIDGLRKDFTAEVGLNVGRGINVQIESSRISAQVRVVPDTDVREFTEVPVLVADKLWEAQVERVAVQLKGPLEAIQAIGEEQVALVVRLPENISRSQKSVVVGPERDASIRYEVLRPGDDIELVQVVPQRFVIERIR